MQEITDLWNAIWKCFHFSGIVMHLGLRVRQRKVFAVIALDDKLLHAVGLGRLSSDAAAHVLRVAHTTLDLHVGMIVSAGLSPRQRAEIAQATRAGDEGELQTLLSLYCPNLDEIVDEQFELLVMTLRRDAHLILAIEDAISENRASYEEMFAALDAWHDDGCS